MQKEPLIEGVSERKITIRLHAVAKVAEQVSH